ncbi:MAG: proteasome accessory factor PafA2 family protein [bacterium]|nr:proteasome accessory factor PafA2 family protein [bacterium]
MISTGEFEERVVGIEMEYSPSIRVFDDDRQVTLLEVNDVNKIGGVVLQRIYKKFGLLQDSVLGSKFLGNGFAAYPDCGSVEVCTPECTPDKVGLAQLASERIVLQTLEDITDRDARRAYLLPLRVQDSFSPGEDYRIASSGMHENYDMQILDYDRTSVRFFGVVRHYAATQHVWSGQGYVDTQGSFKIAQKTNGKTAGAEQIVRHNEGRLEFRRLNYPTTYWQLKHRMAYTSAFIRTLAFLKQSDFEKMAVIYPVISASDDAPLNLENLIIGGYSNFKSALGFQLSLAEKVLGFAEELSFPGYETEAAREVVRICNALKDSELDSIKLDVGWVIKLLGLQRKTPEIFSEQRPSANVIKRAIQYCTALDSLGKGTALAAYRSRRDCDYVPRQIQNATRRPPAIRVARERAKNIRQHLRTSADLASASWMSSEVVPVDTHFRRTN